MLSNRAKTCTTEEKAEELKKNRIKLLQPSRARSRHQLDWNALVDLREP